MRTILCIKMSNADFCEFVSHPLAIH